MNIEEKYLQYHCGHSDHLRSFNIIHGLQDAPGASTCQGLSSEVV